MSFRVLIARDSSRAAELIAALRTEGITAIAEPVTTIERVADAVSLPDLSRVDWIALTSVNAAGIFVDILKESGRVLPPDVRLAAVGPATAQIIRDNLRPPDAVTDGVGGAKLAETILDSRRGRNDFTVLWPCAQDAQPDFAHVLRTRGTNVTEWPVYATKSIPPSLLLSRLGHSSSFDVVVFAAPSAVKSLKDAWPEPWSFTAVAIGQTTAEAVHRLMTTRCITSLSPRTADLVTAIWQALHSAECQTLPSTSKERSEAMSAAQSLASSSESRQAVPDRPPLKYLRAARGENMVVPPVWMMRQAGRYLPEFREVRKQHGFLEVCRTPELACEVTVQPIRRFGFDAAILFSDILVPLVPMGMKLWFASGHGPQILNPVRTRADVNALQTIEPRESLDDVLQTIRMIRAELPPEVALIGFAGAPFTLAAYMVEGGKPEPFADLKKMMYSDPEAFQQLLEKLARMVADYMRAMAEAGADAIQIFDTWAGILTERDFRRVNLSPLQSIFQSLAPLNIPMTYYALGSMHLTSAIRETGCTVAGLDWRTSIPGARAVIGRDVALQGNLDPTLLLGTESLIRSEVRRILEDARGDGGFIFNLGHGILPMTPISSVEIMLDEIHNGQR